MESSGIAITNLGNVFTWGDNLYGQLGNGSFISSLLPTNIKNKFSFGYNETIVDISGEAFHLLLLTSSNNLYSWGRNNFGQVGVSPFLDSNLPINISNKFNLNSTESFVSVKTGNAHSGALTNAGRLFLWGSNIYGQIGNSLNSDNEYITDITSNFGLYSNEKIVSFDLGFRNSIVITSRGRVFTFGYNNNGQLGNGDAGTLESPTLKDKNYPFEITSNFNLNPEEMVNFVSLGGFHSSVITNTNKVFLWGYNSYGQIGNGLTGSSSDLQSQNKNIPNDISNRFNLVPNENFVSLNLGSYQSSALTNFGRVFSWGYNGNGRLGDGSNIDRISPTDFLIDFKFDENFYGVAVGENITPKINYYPSSVTYPIVTWKIISTSNASVDSSGKMTGIKVGDTKFTATAPNGLKKDGYLTIYYQPGDFVVAEDEYFNTTKTLTSGFSTANGTTFVGSNSNKTDVDYFRFYIDANSYLRILFSANESDLEYFLIGLENDVIPLKAIRGNQTLLDYFIVASNYYFIGVTNDSSSFGQNYLIYAYYIKTFN